MDNRLKARIDEIVAEIVDTRVRMQLLHINKAELGVKLGDLLAFKQGLKIGHVVQLFPRRRRWEENDKEVLRYRIKEFWGEVTNQNELVLHAGCDRVSILSGRTLTMYPENISLIPGKYEVVNEPETTE